MSFRTEQHSQHQHPCDEFTLQVLRCHKKYGKQGEDCVREELAQKRCFAQLLCPREARSFYDERVIPLSNNRWYLSTAKKSSNGQERTSSKASCSTIVEVFAKPENEMYIPEGITREDREHCRHITHTLSRCLAKKRNGKRFDE